MDLSFYYVLFTKFFQSNPTTGYDWHIHNNSDEGVASLESNNYHAAGNSFSFRNEFLMIGLGGHKIGGGGSREFKFKANKAGTSEIKLVHKRNWESEETNTHHVKINVK